MTDGAWATEMTRATSRCLTWAIQQRMVGGFFLSSVAGEEKQVWLENHSFVDAPFLWRCQFHFIILNAKHLLFRGKPRQGIHSQYMILVGRDPQNGSRIHWLGSPFAGRQCPSPESFVTPGWMSRPLTFLSHSANSNSFLIWDSLVSTGQDLRPSFIWIWEKGSEIWTLEKPGKKNAKAQIPYSNK